MRGAAAMHRYTGLKGIGQDTIAAVFAGLIFAGLGLVYAYAFGSYSQQIEIYGEWLDMPGFLTRGQEAKQIADVSKMLEETFGLKETQPALDKLARVPLRLMFLELHNKGETVSQPIRVRVMGAFVFPEEPNSVDHPTDT